MYNKSILAFAILALLFVSHATLQAAVLKVGPGEPFSDINDACMAASDNDIILVQAGTYSEVNMDGKGITVAAEPNARVEVRDFLRVINLGPDQAAALIGLDVGMFKPEYHAMELLNNQGSVRIEDCSFRGGAGISYPYALPGWHGVKVEQCADVAFTRCTCIGGRGGNNTLDDYAPAEGGYGLFVADSTVALHDCQLKGGEGGTDDAENNGADGGAGCRVEDGFLFASGSTFQGGKGGGSGMHPLKDLVGGDGGDGLQLISAQACAVLLECVCLGGKGGPGFPWQGYPGQPWYMLYGKIIELTGMAQHFDMPALVREKEYHLLMFQGDPNAQVYLFLSPGPDSLFLHSMKGQWLLAFSPLLQCIHMGTVSGNGFLTLAVRIPDMGPAFHGVTLYLQPVFAQGSGPITLGPPRTLVVVGDQY